MVRRVPPLRPSAFDYQHDFREYLDAWFEARPRRPSQGQFADKVGISRSMMSKILKGERVLQEEYIPGFVKQLNLLEPEATYFATLVRYTQAENELQREHFHDQLLSIRRELNRRQIAEDARQLFSTWYGIALIELSRCAGFRPDPAWIARTMVPPITEDQAREALNLLAKLAGDDPSSIIIDEKYTPADLWDKVDDVRVRNRMLYQMHTEMLEHARRALDELSPAERHFNVVTVSIPAHHLPALKMEIEQFMLRTMGRCGATLGPRERVYQVNVQLFPLTQWTRSEDGEGEEEGD